MSIAWICDALATAGSACFPRMRLMEYQHDGVAYACLDTADAAREGKLAVWFAHRNARCEADMTGTKSTMN